MFQQQEQHAAKDHQQGKRPGKQTAHPLRPLHGGQAGQQGKQGAAAVKGTDRQQIKAAQQQVCPHEQWEVSHSRQNRGQQQVGCGAGQTEQQVLQKGCTWFPLQRQFGPQGAQAQPRQAPSGSPDGSYVSQLMDQPRSQ